MHIEKAVELAVRYAVDLARARNGRLASMTLHGTGDASAVDKAARASLKRLAIADHEAIEVRVIAHESPLTLLSIELAPHPR